MSEEKPIGGPGKVVDLGERVSLVKGRTADTERLLTVYRSLNE